MSQNASNNLHLKLTLAYDGTNYFGWQKTSTGNSVEAEVEKALAILLKQESLKLQAASRTDTGVHACGQVVTFSSPQNVKLEKLNGLLPKDIVALNIEEVDAEFHPSKDCLYKEYRYYVCNTKTQLPKERLYSWHFSFPIDVALMRVATWLMVGKRDFKGLVNSKKNESYSDTMRHLMEIFIDELPDGRLCIHMKADGFMYNMARNIAGLLLQVGRGKIALEDIPAIIEGRLRPDIGITAPAKGLTLFRVHYNVDTD